MQSYFNNPALKAERIAHMRAHIAADELIRGEGWNGSRGCAVGCTFDDYDHGKFPELLGIPEWAGRLLDHLHESTSADYKVNGKPLALAFLEAIKPGSDLTAAEHHIHIFIQRMNLERVQGLDIEGALKKQVVAAIHAAIDVRQKALIFGWDESAAESAAKSAAGSAESAAKSAAGSAKSAWSAAWSAAESAKSAAWSAESAAWSAAWSAAESAVNDAIADEFIRLLGEAA